MGNLCFSFLDPGVSHSQALWKFFVLVGIFDEMGVGMFVNHAISIFNSPVFGTKNSHLRQNLANHTISFEKNS